MSDKAPHILFVNPWIHDFAAYDVWSTPYGLLKLAARYRQAGLRVSYLDCLDRFHPRDPRPRANADGRGPYHKTKLPIPAGLEDVPRRYSRYGIPEAWFRECLDLMSPPDLILVTSMMTYWYPGVQFTIQRLRDRFPDTPIILGGIYASLCPDHARRTSGADHVIVGPGEPHLTRLTQTYLGYSPIWPSDGDSLKNHPPAALDLLTHPSHAPVLTSTGCPFRCAYCASHLIHPLHQQRSAKTVADEIITWHRRLGIRNFAFYDDALLFQSETHLEPLLDQILVANLDLRFHTPNALHLRWLTAPLAGKMHRVGFKTIRLGLETTAFGPDRVHDHKVDLREFEQATAYLKEAGFKRSQMGAYLLAGMPGQPLDSIQTAIDHVCRSGLTPIPAYYTPIPGTALWPDAVSASRYDLAADPIYTNNAVLPCRKEPFSWEYQNTLKAHIRDCLAGDTPAPAR